MNTNTHNLVGLVGELIKYQIDTFSRGKNTPVISFTLSTRKKYESVMAIVQVAADRLGLPLGNCSGLPRPYRFGLLYRHASFIDSPEDFIFVFSHAITSADGASPANNPNILSEWARRAAVRLASRPIQIIVEVLSQTRKKSNILLACLMKILPPVDESELAAGSEWLAENIYDFPQEIQACVLEYIGWA